MTRHPILDTADQAPARAEFSQRHPAEVNTVGSP
jgi:hypothetical protein